MQGLITSFDALAEISLYFHQFTDQALKERLSTISVQFIILLQALSCKVIFYNV